MGPDVSTANSNKPAAVVIPAGKYVTGMTAREAHEAGWVVICGHLSDDNRLEIMRVLTERNLQLAIVNVAEGEEIPTAMPKSIPKMIERRLVNYIIECQPEVKVSKRGDDRPKWAGKKPWWQR